MRTLPCLLLAATALAGDYKGRPGPHAVAAVETLTLEEAPRRHKLPLRVTYPAEAGRYPVLVFSHGMYGSKDGYQPLVRFWVAHGYVCLQPTHPDSLAFGLKSRAQAVLAWDVRPRQVSFLLDSLAEIERRIPGLKGKLDSGRIGVGGHSFGAHTAQLIGGTAVRPLLGKEQSFADARAKALLLLSPQGRGGLLRKDSFKGLTRPALIVTGSKDTSPLTGAQPAWRLDPFKLSPPGDRYLVWIEGAHHGFGGISGVGWRGSGPRNDDHVRIVRQASLAFWDAFVKGDAKARQWLRSGALAADRVRCENRVPTGSSAPPD
ncbi:MAG: alpha/beta hydrolase family protein [Planctomycetota bacterium]|jgi:predicted dienelactone hydrolase